MKNMLASLLLSHGVPMLNFGAECRRTQQGNNNAYCLDNEISWFDWKLVRKNERLLRFCRSLIEFRKAEPTVRRTDFLTGQPSRPGGLPDVSWHGLDGNPVDWTAGNGSLGGTTSEDAGAGVTVLGQSTVGPYDTVQLKSTDPNALDNWLTANGYTVPAAVAPVIANYVQEGFDFLALKLQPGQGVSAMRPVRVTSAGAGLALPLRMVAAGTGATVGITLWVIGDGRYEPQNFKSFVISPSELTWDWNANSSNYTSVRSAKEAALQNAAWQIESSQDLSPYQVENPVLYSGAANDYLPVPADDAGAAGETADQVRQDDLSTVFPDLQNSVWITRMRADLAHAALANDLVVQASADQTPLSNFYQVTKSVNAPTCPAVPNPCPPCGNTGGSPFGQTPSSPFGSPFGDTSTGSGSGGHSGCSTAPDDRGGNGVELVIAGVAALAIFGKRRTRKS